MFSRRNILDGENLEIDASQTAIVLDKNTFSTHIIVLFGFLKCSSQFQLKAGLYHPQQVQARITGNGIKEWACLSDKLHNLETFINHDTRRRIPIQQHLLSDFLQIDALKRLRLGFRFVFLAPHTWNEKRCRASNALFTVNPVLLVHRLEQVIKVPHGFGSTQQKDSSGIQGIVKKRKDPSLKKL